MDKLILPEPGMMIWTLLTFGLLLVLLRVFAWKPILGLLEERERSIRESLDASRRAQEEATSALEENRRILSEARKASNEILQKAEKEAEQVKAGILAKARGEQEDLVQRGRDEIEREKRAAIQEIRGVAVDLALAAAEKLIEARMDDEANRRLVERYLKDLEEVGPSRAS